MIKDSIVKALSDQMNAEYYSAYLYLSMSVNAEKIGHKGIAKWFFVQAQEEMTHGLRFYRYILERGATPSLADIKAPASSFGSVKELFEKTLAHEKSVTASIDKLATLAQDEKDHATYSFMLWFVDEQIEEESGVEDILSKINFAGNHPGPICNLDTKLGGRIFTDATAEEE